MTYADKGQCYTPRPNDAKPLKGTPYDQTRIQPKAGPATGKFGGVAIFGKTVKGGDMNGGGKRRSGGTPGGK